MSFQVLSGTFSHCVVLSIEHSEHPCPPHHTTEMPPIDHYDHQNTQHTNGFKPKGRVLVPSVYFRDEKTTTQSRKVTYSSKWQSGHLTLIACIWFCEILTTPLTFSLGLRNRNQALTGSSASSWPRLSLFLRGKLPVISSSPPLRLSRHCGAGVRGSLSHSYGVMSEGSPATQLEVLAQFVHSDQFTHTRGQRL